MAGRVQTVTFLRDLEEGEKVAPQVKAIISSNIKKNGLNNEVEISKAIDAMQGNVETRQPLERVFGYYVPKMEEMGLISVTRSEAKPKTKKEDDGEEIDADLEDEDEDEDEDDEDDEL